MLEWLSGGVLSSPGFSDLFRAACSSFSDSQVSLKRGMLLPSKRPVSVDWVCSLRELSNPFRPFC